MTTSPNPPSLEGGDGFRQCRACNASREVREFELFHSRTGVALRRNVCAQCRKEAHQRRMEEARTSIENYAAILVGRSRTRARTRGFSLGTLTEGWVVNQWDLQKGLCFYSGEPMEMNSGPRLVTVERLNVGRGYEQENCVLACLCVNMMRASIPMGEFTWWCAKVANSSPIEACPPQKT